MAKLSNSEIIASLKEMSIVELNDLVKEIEKEFGVSAAAPVAAAAPAAAEGGAAAAQTEFTLNLKGIGQNKVAVIKAVQAITGLGLIDAKKLVDTAPCKIKEKMPTAEAEAAKAKLAEAGAEVELK